MVGLPLLLDVGGRSYSGVSVPLPSAVAPPGKGPAEEAVGALGEVMADGMSDEGAHASLSPATDGGAPSPSFGWASFSVALQSIAAAEGAAAAIADDGEPPAESEADAAASL